MKEVVARFASLSPAKQALLQKAQKAAGSNGLKEEPIPPRSAGEAHPRCLLLNSACGS